MAFQEITDTARQRDMCAQLVAALLNKAGVRPNPTGSRATQALWRPDLGLWCTAHSELLDARERWRRAHPHRIATALVLGVIAEAAEDDAAPGEALCTLSFLPCTFKRRRELVWLEDETGRVWLAHRGIVKVPPRPNKQGRDTYLAADNFDQGTFTRTGPFGQARHPVLVLGAMDDAAVLDQLALFVHTLQHVRHGGPTGAERVEALRKARGNWAGRTLGGLFRRGG